MADTFTLPPHAQSISVSALIPEQERAYVQEWYIATRIDAGESIDDFILRLLVSAALDHRKRFIEEAINEEAANVMGPARISKMQQLNIAASDYSTVRSVLLPEV